MKGTKGHINNNLNVNIMWSSFTVILSSAHIFIKFNALFLDKNYIIKVNNKAFITNMIQTDIVKQIIFVHNICGKQEKPIYLYLYLFKKGK
jgi:hypothetical protein